MRERGFVRAIAALLAAGSLWAAAQGPLDGSFLALLFNWATLLVGVLLAAVALGISASMKRR